MIQNGYRKYRHIRRVWLNTYAAWKARRHYKNPAQNMRLIGITGTDGKTTTATFLADILQQSGRKVGSISTIEATINGQSIDTGLHVSTPGPTQNYALLAQMRDAGVQDVVIEATSHGLDQRRLAGINFDIGIVTNIAPEHLDYHGSMEHYIKAKSRLISKSKQVILNADDPKVLAMNKSLQKPATTYGILKPADFRANSIDQENNSSQFLLNYPKTSQPQPVMLSLPGQYNILNALAAVATAEKLGIDTKAALKALAKVQVKGRWQVLQHKPFIVVVDFAHTPQALAQVLPLARQSAPSAEGRVIHVFGSAAQRDESKRVDMGRLSGQFADFTIITMEDPRHEPLDRIQNMLKQGLQDAGKKQGSDWLRIDDRQQALAKAVSLASPGDVIIATGKGHEKSLSIKGYEQPWDEVVELNKLLKKGTV